MAQFVVRKIDEQLSKHGCNVEPNETATAWRKKCVTFCATRSSRKKAQRGGLGTEISALFAKVCMDSDIPELRGHELKAPSFDE